MRTRRLFLLAVCLATFAGAPCGAAGEASGPPPRKSLREAFRTFAADGRYLLTFPARANARGGWLTAGVVGATALAVNRDDEIRAEVLESDGRTAGRIARKFELLGRYEVAAAALGTLYLAGRASGSARLHAAASTAFEAYLWSGIATSVSKGLFGRERPGSGSGEGEFFAGDTIFPSGHTARSFAIAAVFADRYGRKAALVAYPVAALVGLSTVQEDAHWASDILAGAGLGLAIGKGIASRHPAAGRPGAADRPAARAGRDAAWSLVTRPGGALLRIAF